MRRSFQQLLQTLRHRANMWKRLLYVGLAVIVIGLTVMTFSLARNVRKDPIENTTSSWSISGNLTEGNSYVLDIFSSDQWQDSYWIGGYTASQPVDVVIASPDSHDTKLQAFFYALPVSGGSPYKSPHPIFVHVEYETVDYDSMEVDKTYPQIRFTARQGGNYTARVLEQTLNWSIGPPQKMVFYKEVFEFSYPNAILMQSGGVVCLFTGIAICAWAAKTTKKVKISQRKERK